jgi:stage II sporulation protein D
MKLFLLLLLTLAACLRSGAQSINLEEADSARVWVFEDRTYEQARITVHTGSVILMADTDTIAQLKKGDRGIVIERSTNGLFIDHYSEDFASTIRVLATDHSLVQVTVGTDSRVFRGNLMFDSKGRQNTLRCINHVSIEDYVTSVIAGEMPFQESDALKAQAVIARTYALWNMALARRTDYDVTDHTASQMYIGEPLSKPWVRLAAEATQGEVLTWSGKLILSAYFSTSGGTTAANESVWKGKPLPYLRSIDDGDASRDSPHFRWTFSIAEKKLKSAFKNAFVSPKDTISILEKDESGRVSRIQVGNRTMTGQEFRMQMITYYGAKSLKSTFFDLHRENENLVFSGKGMGHGVGLSQWGAFGLARSGWSYVEILKFYYTGVEIANIYHYDADRLELAL